MSGTQIFRGFDCGHVGATQQFVLGRHSVEEPILVEDAKLCPICMEAVNGNDQDPRGVGPTLLIADSVRDRKRGARTGGAS